MLARLPAVERVKEERVEGHREQNCPDNPVEDEEEQKYVGGDA